jgi:hypothetical protein
MRKNHGAILRLRIGLAAAAGNDLEQFNQPGRQVILSPPRSSRGNSCIPMRISSGELGVSK